MSKYKLTIQEMQSLQSADSNIRFEYLVKRVADWEEIWTLKNAEGYVLFGDSNAGEAVPVWPFEEFANQFATDQWADCKPSAIGLQHFLDRWLPGMEKDVRAVAVFPVLKQQNCTVSAVEFQKAIEKALEDYE